MKKIIFIMAFIALTLAACSPGVPGDTSVDPSSNAVAGEGYVFPESDNEYRWDFSSRVEVSTVVYTVTVIVDDAIVNHTEVNAQGSAFVFGGYGSANYRMWQEGKGLLPVKVVAIEPALEYVSVGSYIILKTSDLKAMSLPDGARTVFICNLDTEVLSPVQNGQVLTTNRKVYELDDCRMTTPVFTP